MVSEGVNMTVVKELLALQTLDVELDMLEKAYQAFPSELTEVEKKYLLLQVEVEKIKTKLLGIEKEKKEAEDFFKLEELRLKKSRVRLNEIKNSFEHHALKREVESTERTNEELENKIKQFSMDIETHQKKLDEKEKTYLDAKTKFLSLQAEVKSKNTEFSSVKSEKEKSREQSSLNINPELLNTYKMVRRRFQNALVEVVSGTCQGCFLNVPPQVFNRIAASGQTEQCPHCQRIVFVAQVQ